VSSLGKYILPVLVFFWTGIHAQNFELKINSVNKNPDVYKLNYKRSFPAKETAKKEIEKVINLLQSKGYLLAFTDTIIENGKNLEVLIDEGKLFKTAHLKLGNLDPGLASKLGLSEKLYTGKPFKHNEVARTFGKIIAYYENNGFPFASIQFDSLLISENEITAVLLVKKGKLVKIDSVQIYGTAKVNKKFMLKYLGLKEGMPYNETSLSSVSNKMKQLPFIVETKPAETMLGEKYNRLRLFADKKNASQFDGIIGLLPDAETKKTIVTGDVKLKVVNGIFRNGETFDLEWRRLKSQTQDFKGRIIYPYLFGTPVGTDYSIKIYRRDTTFIDINNNLGIQYYFSGLNNFKVFYKQRNSNIISTHGLENITVLPEYADIETQSYGFGIFLEKLNYRFNPRKGVAINFNTQTGNRKIKKNPKINPVAYDKLTLNSTQYQGEIEFNAYLPLYRNNVLRLGMQSASIFGSSQLFRNEVFRIGGLKTLRGFDEESIFASSYVIPTIEYRFLFAQNSNLLLFTEGAWYENSSGPVLITDTPISVGAGVNFETKAGILSLNYAIGNQFGNGFDPRNGKIHFGLTALF
jgi:outer membrane protein assembly factor BamA